MRKSKSLKVNEKCHSQIKFISKCLNQNMNSFLEELISELFNTCFSSHLPKNHSSRIFYDSHSNRLLITSGGKSYVSSGMVPIATNASIAQENEKVRSELDATLGEKE